MESRNIVLAVLIVAIALGVFYMIDPSFGGLLGRRSHRKEGFESSNNANNSENDVTNYSGANSVMGQPPNMFANGGNDAAEVLGNNNAANGQANLSEMTPNVGRNIAEGFENVPSPMPFASAEKPANCYPKNQLAPQELLPNDANSKWAQVNPMGAGDISGKNFLNAGALIGVNTVGSSLRNASWDLRSEPPNPQVSVSPWLNSTIEPDVLRRPMEIG